MNYSVYKGRVKFSENLSYQDPILFHLSDRHLEDTIAYVIDVKDPPNTRGIYLGQRDDDKRVTRAVHLIKLPDSSDTKIKGYFLNESLFSPNPFSDFTQLKFNLNKSKKVQFCIYNSVGQVIKSEELILAQGLNTITWNGSNSNDELMPAGIYFYSINTGTRIYSGKIIKQ